VESEAKKRGEGCYSIDVPNFADRSFASSILRSFTSVFLIRFSNLWKSA
jgi:hypothetical protein